MNNFLKKSVAAMMILVSAVTMVSCDKDFDSPPAFSEPDITPNTTIAALKARHILGQVETISDDVIIAGVVNADDKSGNYYKQISIQDSTGGITIRLDGTNLYTSYPVGRKVYIKLKGLFIGDYNSLIQIGGSIDNSGSFLNVLPVPSALFDTYIIKGSTGYTVAPKIVAVSDLNASYQSMLIQINNAEFIPGDTAKTYADAVTQASSNLTVQPCTGSSIIVRTSGFANFAASPVPNGNGVLLAIYTTFGSTKQLIVRDTTDVQFNGPRCDGSTGGGGGGTPGTLMTISQLRAMYTGTGIKLTSGQVAGVVISDAANKNVSGGTAIIQDGNYGIAVYFGGTVSYNVGDSIVIDISGDSLINYRGSLELKTAFGTTAPAAVATGTTITPQVRTIAEINTALGSALGSAGNFEFTLLQVANATVSGGATYSGNRTFTDPSGSMILYTASAATFSTTAVPATAKTFVGYPSNFNSTKEFQIRNLNDVQ